MGVNSLPKTVTQQRNSGDLNPGPTAPESSTLTTRLPSHPLQCHPDKQTDNAPLVIGCSFTHGHSHTVQSNLDTMSNKKHKIHGLQSKGFQTKR